MENHQLFNRMPMFTEVKAKAAFVWASIMMRCYGVPTGKHGNRIRELYRERGIEVDVEWHDFERFYEDMYVILPRPSPIYSIDRIDNDKNYGPSNCRWADRKTQANNRSSNVRITVKDKTMTISEWSDISGVPQLKIASRVRAGWDHEAAVFGEAEHSPKRAHNLITYQGKTHSIRRWAQILGFKESTLIARIKDGGWEVERAFTEPENACIGGRGKSKLTSRKMISFGGKTQDAWAWSEETGIPKKVIIQRLIQGWGVEKALTKPVLRKGLTFEHDGRKLTIPEWSRETGIDQKTLWARVNTLGWTIDEAIKAGDGRKSPKRRAASSG
jgi:hypothetical protein